MIFIARKPPKWMAAALLLALATFWFTVRGIHGIHFLAFGDESGHLLGARALRAGDRLYRDFIDAHGPLSFMAAQVFGEVFGYKEPLNARWGIVVLTSFTAITVYRSAAFQQTATRLWGTAIFLGLISAPWLVQSLDMVNYHILGGLLNTIVLSGLVVPAWLGGPIPKTRALLSGFCLALLCAAAYSLAPTALLLVASTGCALWPVSSHANLKQVLANVAIGFAAGFLAILLWLLCFGDIIGYLVFHIISNQVNYARYSAFGWDIALRSLVPSSAPNALVQSSATTFFFLGLGLLTFLRRGAFWTQPVTRLLSLLFLAAAVLMTNFRGAFGFQDGTFLVACIAMVALALPNALAPPDAAAMSARDTWIGSCLIGLVLCVSETVDRGAVTSPDSVTREQFIHRQNTYLATDDQNPIFRRIRSILEPGERLLVLVYNPGFFLPGGFLPVRKFHEYLPWEADYARHPWFGRTRDLCADIQPNPPPVIVYDGWKVWDMWAPESFMPCIPPLLRTDYVADPIPNLYIRRDRLASLGKHP